MLGAIIGDVVGSRFEFHNIKSKDFSMFHPSCHITDDTVMTIAIAKSLSEYFSGIGNLEDLCVKNMQEFGRKVRTTYGTMFYKWIWSDNPEPYNSYGNGAAMRVSPIAYFASSLEECRDLARRVTAVTHNHPQALKGAECVACCVYFSIHNYDKDFIRKYVNENFYKLDFTLDEIRENYTYRGDCDGTVPYALECFLEGDTFEDVIRNAISIGGDSDTIAAIAGSIAEFIMPPKYYKIARHYCRKNLFLWRQFKYVEYARANVMQHYDISSQEYKTMFFPFMKKKKYQKLQETVAMDKSKEEIYYRCIYENMFDEILKIFVLLLVIVAINIILGTKLINLVQKESVIFSILKIFDYSVFVFLCCRYIFQLNSNSEIVIRIFLDTLIRFFDIDLLYANGKTDEAEKEKSKLDNDITFTGDMQSFVRKLKNACIVWTILSLLTFFVEFSKSLEIENLTIIKDAVPFVWLVFIGFHCKVKIKTELLNLWTSLDKVRTKGI